MAGILPNEGENFLGDLIFNNVITDRGTDLEILLFTNSTIDETTTAASLTEPSGAGYSRKTLSDGSWTITDGTASYAPQTFTGGVGGFVEPVYGFAIVTTGTTPRIISIDLDPNAPYTIQENYTYTVTPNITIS